MATDPRVDAYIDALPEAQRELLQHVREVIRRTAPDAEEAISYGMPAFERGGKFFVSYAAWKRHCAIYPVTAAFLAAHRAELEGFGRTKGSLHFTPERPLPDHLLEALVRSELARAQDEDRYEYRVGGVAERPYAQRMTGERPDEAGESRQSFPGDDRSSTPDEAARSWDDAYRDNETPWDIGRPQPAIVRIAEWGGLVEPVLDSGCGSGEHALLAASMGLKAKGVDVSQTAIERARAKARQRGLSAEFLVGDVLDLGDIPRLEPPFHTVIDTGCFHTFANADRPLYASSLASVTDTGALLHLLCFSEDTPGTYGPRRVTEGEIHATFSRDWRVESIEPASFAVSSLWSGPTPSAWLARIVRR
jgi:uncharacterized protein YdhG (YjbR/CyaY superfamily)/SAM-dependent methyltransferase